jgi:probable HAF family extracellular repeat protein
MLSLSWLRHLIPDLAHARACRCHRPRRQRTTRRLQLEPLEDRWCPSASYSVTDLGDLGGAAAGYGAGAGYSEAFGINQAGQVVGEARNGVDIVDAFLWSKGGTDGVPTNPQMKDLGTLGGSGPQGSSANGINNAGQVIGWALTASGQQHAFLWTKGGTDGVPTNPQMKDLGTLPGDSTSVALGINPTSSYGVQVVGYSYSASGPTRAFLWQSSTGMIDLGTLGGTTSSAGGIDDAGEVTGGSRLNGDTVTHAFVWQSGVMTDLGTLGGTFSGGAAINATGQVAGVSGIPKYPYQHAFCWTPNSPNGTTGTMADLGALNLGVARLVKQADALGINDSGYVVGWSGTGTFNHAFYWPGSGSMRDLNNLIPTNSGFAYLESATGINNGGQIVCDAVIQLPSGQTKHAILLTPSSGHALTAAALPAHAVTPSLTVSQATPVPAAQGGGHVLPATASPHGYSLADMARATALFNTSGNNPADYPHTPFQILYVDPATESLTPSGGGALETGTNSFVVAPGTPFYVPLAFVDDSPPILGTFPTDPSATANYVFAPDQLGTSNLVLTVDSRATPIGAAYAAGPVQTPALPDGGGTHIITVGAFLTPLSPGRHTITRDYSPVSSTSKRPA